MCHSHRFDVRAGKYLNADWKTTFLLHFDADRGHRGDYLWSNFAAEIRNVVHVLDDDAVNSRFSIELRFLSCGGDQFGNRLRTTRRAGQRPDMNYTDNWFGMGE